MLRQDREGDIRWRNLALPSLLPLLVTLLLLYLLSTVGASETTATSKNIPSPILSAPTDAIEPGTVKTIWVTEEVIHNDTAVTLPPGIPIFSNTRLIVATPQLAPAQFLTATDNITDDHVFLPIVTNKYCKAKPLCNGDFETGDLSCWHYSHYDVEDELPVQVVPDPADGYRALLGSPDFQCWQGVPTGRAWMTQTFTVPSYGHPQLSFRYEMHTQHTIEYDTFEVFLETQENQYQILKVGQPPPKSGCKEEPNIIAGTCAIDLTNPMDCEGNPIDADFICKHVTLRFENWNRVLIYYNTWTYVDDVEFTW